MAILRPALLLGLLLGATPALAQSPAPGAAPGPAAAPTGPIVGGRRVTPMSQTKAPGNAAATGLPQPVSQAEMIKGKRLRPLAVLADAPLEIEGYGSIPPITDTYPEFKAPGLVIQVGVFVPKGVPDEVVATLDKVWNEKISKSEELMKFAASRGSIFSPATGEKAMEMAKAAVAETAWRMFDSGVAKVSPDTVGIPRP